MSEDGLLLARQWERTALDLFDRTLRFPKAVRATFTTRVDNLVLDVAEGLVTARYKTGKTRRLALEQVDERLARLRVLLRLCHARRYLDHRQYERRWHQY